MQTLNLEAPKSRPYGQRVGNLTRFGETWLNLDAVTAIDFTPEDGCGCEVQLAGDESVWHLSEEDAHCLRAYLTGFEAIQKQVDALDEATMQSRVHPAPIEAARLGLSRRGRGMLARVGRPQ